MCSAVTRNTKRLFSPFQKWTNFTSSHRFKHVKVELDLEYLCNIANSMEIQENVKKRQANGDILKVLDLYKKFQQFPKEMNYEAFLTEALKIPNKTWKHRDKNEQIQIVGTLPKPGAEFNTIAKKHRWCFTEQLSHFIGQKGYYFSGELAELEQALILLAVRRLLKGGFKLMSVPDILPSEDIENCGMPTRGERTQVYRLDERHGKELCLSGTAEMALAARLSNVTLEPSSLPLRLAAVSRCYRAETSNLAEEKGVFRVHQFTKVEMFGVTEGNFEASQKLHEELVAFQSDFFSSLGLHFRILDMASDELGAPAVRKLDLEAYMPGRKIWGELCSASDCGDFQSRRHSLKAGESFAHTVNGTACAIPRTLMALVETHQNPDGTVTLPPPLREIMDKDVIGEEGALKMPKSKPVKTQDRTKK